MLHFQNVIRNVYAYYMYIYIYIHVYINVYALFKNAKIIVHGHLHPQTLITVSRDQNKVCTCTHIIYIFQKSDSTTLKNSDKINYIFTTIYK